MGDTFQAIDNVTIVADSIEIARSPGEFQHVTLGSSAAAKAFASLKSRLPIEMLKITAGLTANDFEALTDAKVYSGVYRFYLDECQSDEAMAALVSDPSLAAVQVLVLSAYHNLSAKALEMFVNSPHWKGVLEFSYSTNVEGAVEIVASSSLLPRLVSLGCNEYRSSASIPAGRQLPLLRRIDEALTMTVFTDARHAQRWLAAFPSTPLRARLESFIARIYSQDDPRTFEQIIADLRKMDVRKEGWDFVEARVGSEVAALLANAFKGQPVAVGTAFADLSRKQQEALLIVKEVGGEWWNVDNILREPLASYGFDFYEDHFNEYLAGKRSSQ